MSAVTQFIRNTAYQSLNDLFLRFVAAATGIVIIRFLSKEDYALLAIILAVVGFLNLISNLGYPTMVVKSISENYPQQTAKAASYYRFTLNVYGLITVFFSAALFLAAPLIADAYHVPYATSLIRLSSLLFMLTSLLSFYNWTFIGLNQIKTFFLKVGLPKEIITLSVVLLLLYHGFKIEGVILAQILGLAVALILAVSAAHARLKGKTGDIDRRGIMRGALEVAPSSLAYASTVYVDVIIIGLILASPMLASYRVCLAVIQIAASFYPIGTFILPTFHATNSDHAKKLFSEIVTFTLIVSLPLIIFVSSFSVEIVTLLFGARYQDSAPVLSLFSLALPALFLEGIFVGAMNYLGRFRTRSVIAVSTAAVNIILLVVLTKWLGVTGSVIAGLFLHYLLVLFMGFDLSMRGMSTPFKSAGKIALAGILLIANIAALKYASLFPRIVLFPATVAAYLALLKWTKVFATLESLKEVRRADNRRQA